MTDQRLSNLEKRLQEHKDLLEVNPKLAYDKSFTDVLQTYPEKIIQRKKELKQNIDELYCFHTFSGGVNDADFRQFTNWLIDNKVNFHPEDDANEYTDADGSKTFTKEIADTINDNFEIARRELSEEVFWKICFDAFRKVNKDIVDCDKCSGKGYYYDDDNDLINCPRCHGEGTLPKGE